MFGMHGVLSPRPLRLLVSLEALRGVADDTHQSSHLVAPPFLLDGQDAFVIEATQDRWWSSLFMHRHQKSTSFEGEQPQTAGKRLSGTILTTTSAGLPFYFSVQHGSSSTHEQITAVPTWNTSNLSALPSDGIYGSPLSVQSDPLSHSSSMRPCAAENKGRSHCNERFGEFGGWYFGVVEGESSGWSLCRLSFDAT